MRRGSTGEDRARLIEELQATLEVIGGEMEALAPYLVARLPPIWAVVHQRALAKSAQEASEMLYAMQDADKATQH